MRRLVVQPGPVEIVGETGGIRVHPRRGGSNRGVEGSGTAALATVAGVPGSSPAVAVAAVLVAVERGRCHVGFIAERVGGEACRRAWFPVGSGRCASVDMCTDVVIFAVVVFN